MSNKICPQDHLSIQIITPIIARRPSHHILNLCNRIVEFFVQLLIIKSFYLIFVVMILNCRSNFINFNFEKVKYACSFDIRTHRKLRIFFVRKKEAN